MPPPRLFPDCSVRDCGHPAPPHIPRTGLSTSFTPDHRRSGLHTRMRLILFPVCLPHTLRLTFFALLLFIMQLFRRQNKVRFFCFKRLLRRRYFAIKQALRTPFFGINKLASISSAALRLICPFALCCPYIL